jgi:hypothetical protein
MGVKQLCTKQILPLRMLMRPLGGIWSLVFGCKISSVSVRENGFGLSDKAKYQLPNTPLRIFMQQEVKL